MTLLTGTLVSGLIQKSSTTYGDEPWPQVGMYCVPTNTIHPDPTPTTQMCPYCSELLEDMVRGDTARIKFISPGLTLKDNIPPTHRVLRCVPCHQIFTAPRVD